MVVNSSTGLLQIAQTGNDCSVAIALIYFPPFWIGPGRLIFVVYVPMVNVHACFANGEVATFATTRFTQPVMPRLQTPVQLANRGIPVAVLLGSRRFHAFFPSSILASVPASPLAPLRDTITESSTLTRRSVCGHCAATSWSALIASRSLV